MTTGSFSTHQEAPYQPMVYCSVRATGNTGWLAILYLAAMVPPPRLLLIPTHAVVWVEHGQSHRCRLMKVAGIGSIQLSVEEKDSSRRRYAL
jgi:hypothetical protein